MPQEGQGRLLAIAVLCVLVAIFSAYQYITNPKASPEPTTAVKPPTIHPNDRPNNKPISSCRPGSYDMPFSLSKLKGELDKHLFGQHIAKSTVVSALASHLDKKKVPTKALAMVFHGWTGNGKSLTVRIIADALYDKGLRNKYVKNYVATSHFNNKNRVEDYKEILTKDINVSSSFYLARFEVKMSHE